MTGWQFFRDWLFKPAVMTLAAAIVLVVAFITIRYTGVLSSPVLSARLTQGQIAAADKQPSVPDGVIYYLPRTVIDVTAEARLRDCKIVDISSKPDDKRQAVVVDFALELTSSARIEPDPTSAYALLAKSFQGAVWSTDLEVEMAEGLMTGLNMKSATAVADVQKLRSLLEGIQAAPAKTDVVAGAPPPDIYSACGTRIVTDLRRRDQVVELLKGTTNEGLAAIYKSELTAIGKSLSGEFRATMVPLRQNTSPLELKIDPSTLIAEAGTVLRQTLQNSTIHIVLSASEMQTAPIAGTGISGVVYRTPMPAILWVCREDCQLANGKPSPQAQLQVGAQQIPIAQFGIDAVMPVVRWFFSDNKVGLSFSKDAVLTKVTLSDRPISPSDIIKPRPPEGDEAKPATKP
jgi:hypothetical protein